jgi:small subunit ribosomal protein S20
MANIKSAEKRIKQTAKRQLRNRGVRSRLRTAVKQYRELEDAKKGEKVSQAYSDIDKAKKKGAIHKNAAARYKSRLARKAARAKTGSQV